MNILNKEIIESQWPIGSVWRRWDLHIHTPLSMLGSSYAGVSFADFIDELEKKSTERSISVIGVTDYMTIDGYTKLHEEKYSNNRLTSIDLLIPNIEFRMMPQTADGKALNLHLLVDPAAENHIERINAALRNLRIDYDGQTYGCVKDEIIEFGKAQDPSLDNEAAYKFGIEQFKLDKTIIKNWIEKERWLRNNSLIGIANGKDGISGLPLDGFGATRDEILRWCDFVFSGNPSDRKHYLGEKEGAPASEIIRQYRSLKPCLHGSDAHTLETLFSPDKGRFCWIKSDPTFHGLRQVLWEPATRVHVGEIPPQLSDTSQIITKIKISNSKKWFELNELILNPFLVAVIGEKGSGKTAIADMIAMASGVSIDPSSQSSFVTKGAVHLNGVQVDLEWGGGEITSSILPNTPFPSSHPRVRYLSQDFVEQLCSSDHQGVELQNAIEDVIFARLNEIQKEGYSSFTELRNARESASQARRDGFRGELASLHKEIERKSEAVRNKPQKILEKSDAEKKVLELQQQLPSATASIDEAILTELDATRLKKKELETDISVLQRKRRKIESSINLYSQLKIDTNLELNRIIEELKQASVSDQLLKLMSPGWDEGVNESLNKYVKNIDNEIATKTGLSESIESPNSLSSLQSKIFSLEEKLANDEVARKRILDLKKEITRASSIVERLTKEIERIDGPLTNSLEKLKQKQLSIYLQVFQALSEDEEGLAELYSPLKDAIQQLGEEVQFSISVGYQVDTKKWSDIFNQFFDNRRVGVENARTDLVRAIETNLAPSWKSGDKNKIELAMKQFIDEFEPESFLTKYGASKLTLVEIFDWVFSTDHIKLTYKIKYGGTELENLSPGTRGIALLVLYLLMDEDDKRPLLIDQPEGNLDNSSVFEQLVPYIQKAKLRRQVILITHNPNLVVATDAEQVIVASASRPITQPYPLIKYTSGALEHSAQHSNMGVREAVCLFLEGGKDAFQVRENRYALEKRQASASGA